MANRTRQVFGIAAASVALGVATSTLLSAELWGPPPRSAALCDAPALADSDIDVRLTDMGGMIGQRMMGNRSDGYMWPHMRMMDLAVSPPAVSAGVTSLRVRNAGAPTHEVLILPLTPGQSPGQRAINVDGQVDESGSVGEASRT